MLKRIVVGFCVAGFVVTAVASILWSSFEKQCDMRAAILTARAQGVLCALEGGIRSWRRVNPIPLENAEILLLCVARADPEVLGLAVFDPKGNLLAQGDQMPPGLTPSASPRSLPEGFFVCKAAELVPAGAAPVPTESPGPGADNREKAVQWVKSLDGPVWLGALMDSTAYDAAVRKDKWAMVRSLVFSFVLTLLGLILLALYQQRRHRLGTTVDSGPGEKQEMARTPPPPDPEGGQTKTG